MGAETASAHTWLRVLKEFQGRGKKNQPQSYCLDQKNPDKGLRESVKGKKKPPKHLSPICLCHKQPPWALRSLLGDVFPLLIDGIFQAVINWASPLWADLWSSSSFKALGTAATD